jgi:hypothetical protein
VLRLGEAFGHIDRGVDRRIIAQMLRPYQNFGNELLSKVGVNSLFLNIINSPTLSKTLKLN